MLGRSSSQRQASVHRVDNGSPRGSTTLLTIVGDQAKLEGKFDITESNQVECEIGGQLRVGGKLVIGERGVVRADVETVDAIIQGQYEGNMVATGNVEITRQARQPAELAGRVLTTRGREPGQHVLEVQAQTG